MEQKEIVNEHLRNNSSSDTEDDVRTRRRMHELQAEHDENGGNKQMQAGDQADRDTDQANSR